MSILRETREYVASMKQNKLVKQTCKNKNKNQLKKEDKYLPWEMKTR